MDQTNRGGMIPRLLHFIWLGDKEPLHYYKEWSEKLSNMPMVYWDNDNIKPFARKIKHLDIPIVQATDILRLMILEHYGGIYMDHDYEVVNSFEFLLNVPFVGTMNQDPYPGVRPIKRNTAIKDMDRSSVKAFFEDITDPDGEVGGKVEVCFMASANKHPALTRAIEIMIEDNQKPRDKRMSFWDWGNGTQALTQAFLELGFKLDNLEQSEANDYGRIYPPKYFFPSNKDPYAFTHHHTPGLFSERFNTLMGDEKLYEDHLNGWQQWCDKHL